MPYDKSLPYSCPCCGYWNGDMKYDYYKHNKKEPLIKGKKAKKAEREVGDIIGVVKYSGEYKPIYNFDDFFEDKE